MSQEIAKQEIKAFPSLGRAVLLLLLQSFVVAGAFVAVEGLKTLHLVGPSPHLIMIEELLGLGVTLWIVRHWSQRTLPDLLALKPVPNTIWGPLLLSIAGLYFFIMASAGFVFRFLPAPPAWLNEHFLTCSYLRLIVGAPLIEEVLFRGVILGGFLQRYSPRKAILGSAVLFALAHLNLWQLVPALVLGLFTGWVFSRTRSLWPVLAIHMVHNAVCCLGGVPNWAPMWILGLGLGLLAIGVLLLSQVFRSVNGQPLPFGPG